MSPIEEKNLRAGLMNLIAVASDRTGDSAYYVSRIAETMLNDFQRDQETKAREKLAASYGHACEQADLDEGQP